jgi:uncharacterized cupin superfamily protein
MRANTGAAAGKDYSLSASLGDVLGFSRVHVSHEVLLPGRRGSGAHSHSLKEELIVVLRGRVVAHDGEERVELVAGEFVGFYPGKSEFHYYENISESDAELLVVSSVDERDQVVFGGGV